MTSSSKDVTTSTSVMQRLIERTMCASNLNAWFAFAFALLDTVWMIVESGARKDNSDYIVDMNEYVNNFMQMKEEYEEQKCEAYAEARYFNCDDNNDEGSCLNDCYYAANMSYCIRTEGDLDINEYMKCAQYKLKRPTEEITGSRTKRKFNIPRTILC